MTFRSFLCTPKILKSNESEDAIAHTGNADTAISSPPISQPPPPPLPYIFHHCGVITDLRNVCLMGRHWWAVLPVSIPQLLAVKGSSAKGIWHMHDIMRWCALLVQYIMMELTRAHPVFSLLRHCTALFNLLIHFSQQSTSQSCCSSLDAGTCWKQLLVFGGQTRDSVRDFGRSHRGGHAHPGMYFVSSCLV